MTRVREDPPGSLCFDNTNISRSITCVGNPTPSLRLSFKSSIKKIKLCRPLIDSVDSAHYSLNGADARDAKKTLTSKTYS